MNLRKPGFGFPNPKDPSTPRPELYPIGDAEPGIQEEVTQPNPPFRLPPGERQISGGIGGPEGGPDIEALLAMLTGGGQQKMF